MAIVTLLALNNSDPNIFASVTAVHGGHPCTNLDAILLANAFIFVFIVSAITVLASTFPLNSNPFAYDVFFYLFVVFALFYIYLTAKIFL